MRIATLFSGIGAPEQAMHRINPNFKTIFACEWDKFARKSYSAIYNIDEAHFHKDVHDMDGTQYQGKVDILVGGSPCQAFSIAGLRSGTNDERGQLIYQYIRIVDEVKAPIIVYENVKGMLSIDGGRTIKEFVQALRDIGYHCHYEVVNTKDYGVPQNRERIFLVGFLDHEAYLRFSFAPKQKLDKRLKDVLEDSVDEKYYLKDSTIAQFTEKTERAKREGNGFAFKPSVGDNIAYSITTKAGGRVDDNFIDVIGLLDCKGTDQIRRVYGIDGVAATLTTMHGGNQEPKILQLGRGFNNGGEHNICPTLTRCSFENNNFVKTCLQEITPKIGAMRGRNHENPKSRLVGLETVQMIEMNENGTSNCLTTVQKDNLVVEPQRIRKLTPLECWRLQDFPDEAHNKAKAVGVSDSQLYKQAGNSMSVNVLEMIFRQIISGENSDSLF